MECFLCQECNKVFGEQKWDWGTEARHVGLKYER